eukprot:1430629-Rhodomonas_salina.2
MERSTPAPPERECVTVSLFKLCRRPGAIAGQLAAPELPGNRGSLRAGTVAGSLSRGHESCCHRLGLLELPGSVETISEPVGASRA